MKASSKNYFSFESHTQGNLVNHTTAGHSRRRLPSSQILKTLLLTVLLLAGWGSCVMAQKLDLMSYLTSGWTWGGTKTNNGDGSVTYTSNGNWQGLVAGNLNQNLLSYTKLVVEFSGNVNDVQVLVRNYCCPIKFPFDSITIRNCR